MAVTGAAQEAAIGGSDKKWSKYAAIWFSWMVIQFETYCWDTNFEGSLLQ